MAPHADTIRPHFIDGRHPGAVRPPAKRRKPPRRIATSAVVARRLRRYSPRNLRLGNRMRSVSRVAGAMLVLLTAACSGGGYGPTEQDIRDSLEAMLQSVAGHWTGVSSPPNTIRLDFNLQEDGNGLVSGTGTMNEANVPTAVPITVSGTFQRPTLTLAFDGMVFESRHVRGTLQGTYTTVGGIATNLTLTAPGYSRDIPVLLQER
jgi:hypothetical protein